MYQRNEEEQISSTRYAVNYFFRESEHKEFPYACSLRRGMYR